MGIVEEFQSRTCKLWQTTGKRTKKKNLIKKRKLGVDAVKEKSIGGEPEVRVVMATNWLGCCWIRKSSSCWISKVNFFPVRNISSSPGSLQGTVSDQCLSTTSSGSPDFILDEVSFIHFHRRNYKLE